MIRTLTSLQHPIIKHVVKLRQNHDYREECSSVVVEGIKPIQELPKDIKIKSMLVYDSSFIPSTIKLEDVYIVTPSMMQKASGMQTPEGILAEVEIPSFQSLQGLGRIVAFDTVRDPGNVGTLLRTALAFGWEGAYFVNESCDPFNEKSLRAARGATFRMPLAKGDYHHLKALCVENELTPFVADIKGQAIGTLTIPERALLVLGNEAHGPSEEILSFCRPVTIPMPGNVESLNVSIAGGILMHAFQQQRG